MFKLIRNNRYLLFQLIKNDIKQKYQGSVLGILWSFIVPILMLIIYTFMFSVVFQAKWDIDTTDKYQFALVLFCGLSAFNILSEVMSRSAGIIASNVNYVKKVIFPLELFPVVLVCTALFTALINFLILVIVKVILYHNVSKTLFLFLPALLPLIILALGVGLFVSATSVYLKDIANIISVLVTVLMYMSPVFFPLSAVPENVRIVCEINPMTYIIENVRKVVLYSEWLDLKSYGISLLVGIAFATFGYFVFKRAKEGFADVL